jgi:hypothetical protein
MPPTAISGTGVDCAGLAAVVGCDVDGCDVVGCEAADGDVDDGCNPRRPVTAPKGEGCWDAAGCAPRTVTTPRAARIPAVATLVDVFVVLSPALCSTSRPSTRARNPNEEEIPPPPKLTFANKGYSIFQCLQGRDGSGKRGQSPRSDLIQKSAGQQGIRRHRPSLTAAEYNV